MMFVETVIFLLALNQAVAITLPPPDKHCDYERKIKRDQHIEVKSPGWPNLYRQNKICRWIIDCPISFVCRLRCHDMAVPESRGCTADVLLVSRQGSNWLIGANKYCGTRIIDTSSSKNRITIGFISSSISPGGRFRCKVTPELRETD